jgi:hypothetical protein
MSAERGCAHLTCPLRVSMQLLAEASAEQADRYAKGDLRRVEDVNRLVRIHDHLRRQLCPVVATQPLGAQGLETVFDGLSPEYAARLRDAECPAWATI